MRRVILFVAAPLLALALSGAVAANSPARARFRGEGAAELADDAYCKNWCCERVCNEKNQCYRYCWCCG